MKSVLITGTSKGIGYETALAFARAGYRVHATMRNPAQSPALAAVSASEKLPIAITTMDVDNDDSVSKAFAAIHSQHGPVDVLINNAGVERSASIEESALDDFRATMETNYFGALRCIKAVVPHMRQRRSGSIINISSVAGSFSMPPMTAYCASKWALEAMSESLACEMKAFGVRVLLVKPGIIDTAMAQRIKATNRSAYPHAARISSLFVASLPERASAQLRRAEDPRHRDQRHVAVASSCRPRRRPTHRMAESDDRRTVDRSALFRR